MMLRIVIAAMALAMSAASPTSAAAQSAPKVTIGAAQCARLAGDHSDIVDAPAEAISAKIVPQSGFVPAYCAVTGYIAPYQSFEFRAPLDWNGRFVQVGCGGMCGAPVTWLCDDAMRRGFSCIAPALGHVTANDAKWARNNLQARIDFGFRGVHVANLVGKALTAKAYGAAPRWSYFLGSSTGGRLSMVAAQKFPYDFDGILSGVPIMNQTGDQMAIMWGALALRGPDGRSLLDAADLKTLHAAVLDACDLNDGVKDGLIGDPRACNFDPSSLSCLKSKTAACFSAAQVAGVRKMYAGPTDGKGRQIYPGGFSVGSELEWANGYIDGGRYRNSVDRFVNMSFFTPPASGWKPEDFDWNNDYKRLDLSEAIYGAVNPDLRRFKAAGGKLLQFQAWNDEAVLPMNTVDYYESVTRLMGGADQTQDFYRLFMIPGSNHAGDNYNAGHLDWFAALLAWVENGRAPDRLVGGYLRDNPQVMETIKAGQAGRNPSLRVAGTGHVFSTDMATDAAFTRPLYPYPAQSHYSGRGDPNSADSYRPANGVRP